MSKDGKWRFTSPTHVVLAFAQALRELEQEGGITARHKRYSDNNKLLISRMRELGFKTYAIYPGKVTEADTFRIGNIGEIYEEDIIKVTDIIRDFLAE